MINSSNLFLDFTVSSVDTISLTPEQIEQAAQWGNSRSESDSKWQTYLNALALFGVESWLNQRESSLVLNRENLKHKLNSIGQLKIGEFKLCLLTQGTLDDETITIPREAIELPNDIAHLYVLVVVDEEQEQVSLEGVIRYDQLRNYLQSENLTLQTEQTYEIPVTWFDPDVNHLLLYLRCLEPSAIQLPNTFAEPKTQELIEQLIQPVINVGLWLQGELDELAERLSWLLLPNPELATASFRSLPTFELILQELGEQGLLIPNTARGASQDFNMGETVLRWYALTWLLEDSNEWSLLLILGSPSDRPLPEGLKMQIRDANSILSEQEITPNSDQTYLYTRVIGEPNELFRVTLTLENGENLTLPPFTFPSESL